MDSLLQKISEFASRPCAFTQNELYLRKKHMQNLIASNTFEGLHASDLDNQLYDLVIEGKVSTNEYLALCKEASTGSSYEQ
jgi:hypothetical protein